ncbi:MAG TPA: YfhO family protein [Rubrobacteraceae bacterium]|nr:YfhO family protein [Rubrobacteraceae bacterium]
MISRIVVTAKKLNSRLRPSARRRLDLLAVTLLVVLTVFAEWSLLRGGTVVGTDAVTQYIPWYSFLGEQLRSGEVPGWNPYQLSGTPFAADPLSGWTYLPAMVFFTFLPLVSAAKVYLFFHPLLAGLGAHALARALRINVAGALLAAVAYEYVGYVYVRNTCCFAYVSVLAWLPFAILGTELAIRSKSWLRRGLWWAVSGLAISQILAAWLGQGSYYALLGLGGYVAYRTLLFPPDDTWNLWRRTSGLVMHGSAVLLFGFGLAAAGILPRLQYNARSNLAGGYPDSGPGFGGGWSIADWEKLFVTPGFFYAGSATLALALVAPLVVRRWHAVPYFTFLALFALTLSGTGYTLVHSLLYLLPNFESLQPHYPQRSLLIFYLPAVLLAGATVSSLGKRARSVPYLVVLPVLAAVFLVTRSTVELPIEELEDLTPENPDDAGLWDAPLPFLLENGVALLPGSLLVLALVLVFVTAYALIPHQFWILRGLAATLLALAVFTDLYSVGKAVIEDNGGDQTADQIISTDLGDYYDPTDATRLLRPEGEEPFRFVAYDPGLRYQRHFMEPKVRALEAEGRPTALRIQSTQIYHAVHLARYDEYLETMNGEAQNYHSANVLPEGLDSPLLDLLNTRRVVVPSDLSGPDAASLERLKNAYPTIYQNERVRVLEHEDALPRAWIVHSARQMEPNEALKSLGSGEINPRETALLEREPPPLGDPDNTLADRVEIESYNPDRIELDVFTGVRSLLVMSEVYYPAWKAYVDGEPVPLYRANHLFRGVPIPQGEHTVELRYESASLRAGIAISSLVGLIFIALAAANFVRGWRKRTEGRG